MHEHFRVYDNQLGSIQLFELSLEIGALLCGLHEYVELGRGTGLRDLAQRDHGAQRTLLQLRCALEILFHGVLRDRRALHALLERRRDVVQTLRYRGGRHLREAEEHHVAYDLHFVRLVLEAGEDVREELVQLQLR